MDLRACAWSDAACRIFGLSAAALGIGHSLLAPTDILPIAVVLGAGVLAWLLGNRRPRVQPATARRPSRQSDPARR